MKHVKAANFRAQVPRLTWKNLLNLFCFQVAFWTAFEIDTQVLSEPDTVGLGRFCRGLTIDCFNGSQQRHRRENRAGRAPAMHPDNLDLIPNIPHDLLSLAESHPSALI